MEPPLWLVLLAFAAVAVVSYEVSMFLERRAAQYEQRTAVAEAETARIIEETLAREAAAKSEPEVDPTRDEHVAFPDVVALPQADAPEAWNYYPPIDAGPIHVPRLDVPPVVHDEVMKVTYVRREDLQ